MTETELKSIYDNSKSFYKKAYVLESENKKELKSFSTIVCIIENNKPIVKNTYSHTSLRHIKEFLKQNGFTAENKNQILKDYKPTEEEKEHEEKPLFNIARAFLMLGNVGKGTLKEKNNYKIRILKASFENKGLIFPNDWNTLTEEEKEKRLNKIEEIL